MQRPQPDPQKLPPRAPSQPAKRCSGDGAALAPTQRIGEPSSQAAAAAAAAARERALKQMAYEDAWKASNRDFKTPFASDEDARKASNPDFKTPFASDDDAWKASNPDFKTPFASDDDAWSAWKASNPDFKTPFASVEDAVSRLPPYHVLAENIGDAHASGAKSSAKERDDGVEDKTLNLVSEFDKQVLAFNPLSRERADGSSRGEELYMLERALFQDERLESEHARAVIVQQEKQRQEEAARTRLALGQAQAQMQAQVQAQAQAQVQAVAAGVWQTAQALGNASPYLLRTVWALACGVGPVPDTAGTIGWLRMEEQVLLQKHQQQQQQLLLLQQQLGMGVWPTFVAPRGEGSASGQAARAPAVPQDQAGGQTASGAAAARTTQQWWQNAAPKEQ